jgi:small-conductance mechanosensitive channel
MARPRALSTNALFAALGAVSLASVLASSRPSAHSTIPLLSSLQIFLGILFLARAVQGVVLPHLLNAANAFSTSTLDDKAVDIIQDELNPATHAGLAPVAAQVAHIYIALFMAAKPLHITMLDRFEPEALCWMLIWWRVLSITWRIIHLLCTEALPNTEFAKRQNIGAGNIETILRVARVIFWSISGLFVAENVGLQVGSLIASAGIGGVAVALSAQQVLQDILAALTMLLDHTVSNGDFVVLAGGGDVAGTVISRGWKSTRLASPSGQVHVVANRDICSARIQRFAPTMNRREVLHVRLDMQTEAAALERVAPMLEAMVKSLDGCALQACYLKEFEPCAIVFDLYVGFPNCTLDDYRRRMHNVNLGVAHTLAANKLRLAVPYKVMLKE